MRSAGKLLLVFSSLGVAAYALLAYSLTPLGSLVHPDMRANFVAHPVGIYCHVFAASVALLLGPLQFSARLRRASVRVHRWIGCVYLGVGVLVGGLSGLYMSQFAFGGAIAKLGFLISSMFWLYSGVCALLAVRRGAIEEHRRWMVRNFAIAFGAITLRLYLAASIAAGLDFDTAYAIIAWLCWLPNVLVAEWLYNTRPGRSAFSIKPMPSVGRLKSVS
jgi:uncharacterized membrane protein